MGMWTSLAMLSVAAVSTLSFPHPGPPIPPVGAGTRAQYYVLKPDGTFTYGYDTGNGLHETATKLESGDVQGEFGYKNADGEHILLQYTAGEGGFVPQGNFLPKPVEASALSSSQGSPNQYSAPARAAPAPATPVEIADIRGGIPAADGSYHFSYDTSSSSRSETADADLNIIGHYSFIADDGVSRSIDYKAGSATGFIAEGDHLPKVSEGDFGVHAAPRASASAPSLAYSVPSASSVNLVATKSSSPSAPRSDASYSFSYDAGDSARSESADADLNVVGSYRFTANDGVSRSVNYQAGSATGFIAEGDHLPKPVDALAGAGSAAFGNVPAATSYQAPVTKLSISPVAFEEAVIRGGVPAADGSYHFSYDTSSSSRSESADALNSVTGSFGFEADDGVHRSIQYTAGAETGFIAEGAHLPVGPSVPGAESGIPTGRIFPILSEEEANALAAGTSGAVRSSSSLPFGAPFAPAPAVIKSSSPVTSASDASYSFSYNAGDSSRTESADADLNILGSYSFTADDGVSRSVNYKAGSATGFVAEGDHLPKPVVADTGSSIAASYSAPTTSYTASPALSYGVPSAPSPTVAFATKSSNPVPSASDASYSFSYNAGDSSRTESADADLNVLGSYSFTADDGVSRSVNYKAGSATGFIAEGDHLPKPVVADTGSNIAASYSAPATSYTASASPTSSGLDESLIRSSSGDDGSYSFSYETDSSSRSETADADLNIVGSYSFTADDGISRSVNYQAGAASGFVAEGDHLPKVDDTGSSALSVKSSPVSAGSNSLGGYDYSAPSVAAAASVVTKSSTPFEEAQVRSTSNDDGSYFFSYETASSSRSESADAFNSVTGNFGFVADDGIHRSIEYKAGAETGFIADGAHLPVGPAVPGAESGIPTGRILPILSEDEANALAGASAQFRSTDSSDEDDNTPSDASYSFSFASDSYSRNEEADVDGNVKGSYTYTGDDGIIRTVNFVAGRETGFAPEGEYTEAAGSSIPSASRSHSAPLSASYSASSTSYQAPAAPAAPVSPALSYIAPSHSSNVATKSSALPTVSGNALDSIVIGDVKLVHANAEASPTMYGYSFSAI